MNPAILQTHSFWQGCIILWHMRRFLRLLLVFSCCSCCLNVTFFLGVQYSSNLFISNASLSSSSELTLTVLNTSTASSPTAVSSVEHCTGSGFLSIPVAFRYNLKHWIHLLQFSAILPSNVSDFGGGNWFISLSWNWILLTPCYVQRLKMAAMHKKCF